ncbi:MAG: hypothetical protein D6788_11515 [Planctomycetota bacterium]|nr:MAG: hypothetical protein D6788_11515 [Planctomycetota bacterium]
MLVCALACRPDAPSDTPETKTNPPPAPKDVLVFPASLHADDEEVNAFVRRAMETCATGDYDRFRLLWSAREEPLPRAEYEKGWQAVQEIRILALQRVVLETKGEDDRPRRETVYALLAKVSLDPQHPAAGDRPVRDVALMLVREQNAWRLASAPRKMRQWLKDRFASDRSPGREKATSVPQKRETGKRPAP